VVRGKKAFLVGLAIVLALTVVGMAACGGGTSKEAKAALKTAVEKINLDMNAMQTALMSGGTVADLKAFKDGAASDWQAVVTAAKNVEGADAVAAEKAWTDLDTAITALPDDADLLTAYGQIQAPVTAIQALLKSLGELVGVTPAS
jgi:hypothetical protein